ncbi:hypothetical protein B5F12_08905 [Pseudoflavonifractor sp. An176]|uniref:DUF3185 family protein n=1 Tax=Pseudoflavonifractor sp. An176 TaxID=1965572 RepID=UPI000B378D26|nr:DUF3185 family protein [Pseudoflavonifractor sp. An176]OUP62986.1 hypothetical protein B5F12_08905 [Pseudoflavonifractor sp. An176]
MILGAILLVLGVACAGYGYLQNNSIEAQLSSLLSTGTTNPGTIYIIIGAVVAVIGALVCGWSLYKRHGKGGANVQHQEYSVPIQCKNDAPSHENDVERVEGTGTELHVDQVAPEQEKENDWTVEQPLPVDEESDALNQQSEEPKEKKGIKITRKMCILGGVALVAVIGIAVLARFGYVYWTDPQRDVDRKAAGEYATAVDYYESGEYDLALEKTEAIDTTWTCYQKAEKLRVDIIKARLDEIRSSYEGDQKYTEVISYVKRKVPNLDIDAEIREQYEQAIEEYKASVLKKADELESTEDYSGAVREVETALQLIGSDAKLEERVHQLGKTEILKAVETYEASKEYDTAIELISDRIGDYETDSEVVLAYNRCKDAFRDTTVQAAKNAYTNEGFQAALSIVNNALMTMEDDAELQTLAEYYRNLAPVKLSDLESYRTDGGEFQYEEVETDCFGTEFFDNLTTEGSETYRISGKYATLKGVLFSSAPKSQEMRVGLKCWGDGVLLCEYNTTNFNGPIKFSVDVSGIKDLKIELDAEDGELFSDFGPWDVVISGCELVPAA